jgi:tRNA threonylcarbamoyladenosine biosynthesis protein TsaE
MSLGVRSRSISDTAVIAKIFAEFLRPGDVVGFSGDLGAGKTAFIREVVHAWGVPRAEITSTSFVVAREYPARIPVLHADVYRLCGVEELPPEVLEFIDARKGVVMVEWMDVIGLDADWRITIEQTGLDERLIYIDAARGRLTKLRRGLKDWLV